MMMKRMGKKRIIMLMSIGLNRLQVSTVEQLGSVG